MIASSVQGGHWWGSSHHQEESPAQDKIIWKLSHLWYSRLNTWRHTLILEVKVEMEVWYYKMHFGLQTAKFHLHETEGDVEFWHQVLQVLLPQDGVFG